MGSTSTQQDLDVARIARVLLADRNLSQTDLARNLSLDSGQVSRAMSGKRKWTLTEVATMAKFFDVSVALFFDDPDTLLRSRCSLGAEQLDLFAVAA